MYSTCCYVYIYIYIYVYICIYIYRERERSSAGGQLRGRARPCVALRPSENAGISSATRDR